MAKLRWLVVLGGAWALLWAEQKSNPKTQPSGSQVQSWQGTLVDALKTNCSVEVARARAGENSCPANVRTSEFGLLLADGKFVKFDEGGNAKAAEALKKSRKGSKAVISYWKSGKASVSVIARVTGTLTSDTLNLDSIRID